MKLFSRDVLRKGDKGPDVAVLQVILLIAGYNERIIPDGEFGEPTEVAIKHLQDQQGLEVTGEFGKSEREQLKRCTELDVDVLEAEHFASERLGRKFFGTKPTA